MTSSANSQRVLLTRLSGMPVHGPNGERLGEIENLSVNVRDGAIESARLRLAESRAGRTLRIDLPWSLLRLHPDGRRLSLDIGLPTLVSVAARRAASGDG